MRPDQTINIPPPRRRPYPAARTRMDMNMPPAEDTFTPDVDWSLWRGMVAIQNHANQRSNPVGDGIDSMRANTGGERLSLTLPAGYAAGTALRVAHGLKRVPSAIVHFNTQNPATALRGQPAGSTGANSNPPWTEKEVWVVSNGAAGETFDFLVA